MKMQPSVLTKIRPFWILAALSISIASCAAVSGQSFVEYRKILDHRTNGRFNPGSYFVLVSADWCRPCRALKTQLSRFPKSRIYVVDYDQDRKTADKLLRGRPLPGLYRFDVDANGVSIKRTFGSVDLDTFMIPPSVSDPPTEPKRPKSKDPPKSDAAEDLAAEIRAIAFRIRDVAADVAGSKVRDLELKRILTAVAGDLNAIGNQAPVAELESIRGDVQAWKSETNESLAKVNASIESWNEFGELLGDLDPEKVKTLIATLKSIDEWLVPLAGLDGISALVLVLAGLVIYFRFGGKIGKLDSIDDVLALLRNENESPAE